MSMTTANMALLTRAEIWSSQLKEVFVDRTMYGKSYVDWLTDFPDGDTFTIPSIGEADTFEVQENQPIQYSALDTGEFQFSITEYVGSAHYITKKARQDSYKSAALEAAFLPAQIQAIEKRLESDILRQGQPGTPGGQTVGALNLVNGAAHRWVGSDTFNGVRVIGPEDFSRAKYALKKANVPLNNLVSLVSPEVAVAIENSPNLINFSSANAMWEDVVTDSLTTGMRFVKNIFGFDIYESNFLPLCGANQSGASETISTVASGTGAICNVFFSASSNALPFKGAWRQMPEVDAEYNKDLQREEYVTTCRYGLKLFRPENFVTVLSHPGIF